MAKQEENSKEAKTAKHIFVKYGSSAIDVKVGRIEKKFGLDYIHRHDGNMPKIENKNESYNENMKIRAFTIYKFDGSEKSFSNLLKLYSNLEIISDKN